MVSFNRVLLPTGLPFSKTKTSGIITPLIRQMNHKTLSLEDLSTHRWLLTELTTVRDGGELIRGKTNTPDYISGSAVILNEESIYNIQTQNMTYHASCADAVSRLNDWWICNEIYVFKKLAINSIPRTCYFAHSFS